MPKHLHTNLAWAVWDNFYWSLYSVWVSRIFISMFLTFRANIWWIFIFLNTDFLLKFQGGKGLVTSASTHSDGQIENENWLAGDIYSRSDMFEHDVGFYLGSLIVHPLYKAGYVTPCVGNLTEEKSRVSYICLNFQQVYIYIYIVTCDYRRGLDCDSIYWPLIHTTRDYTLQRTVTYTYTSVPLQSPLVVAW
jgi:hypothetical protein